MEGKAKVALTFALYQGDQLVRRDSIAQDIVKVGKDPRSHLRVDDDLASRMHAVIEVAGPNDATIRVRPGPVRTTLIRPRTSFVPEMLKSVENL